MIKALFLVFDPVATWERIALNSRRCFTVFFLDLLPVLILTSVVEAYGLLHWGRARGAVAEVTPFSKTQTFTYEGLQFVLTVIAVWLGAKVIKSLGDTFHGRHSLDQTMTVVVYSLCPMFLLRILNAVPAISPWFGWAFGILLAMGILYHGIPRIMKPDPPHAFGLFLTSTILLTFIMGIVQFVTYWYLLGKFTKLDTLVSHFTGH